ncbi:MAG TPA: alkaline phosphatase family protein [Thermoanaerobaculia bacterium]
MAKPLTDRIEHVVVLMLENRSFDNVLGGLHPDKTRAGLYRGLRGNEANPLDPANPRAGSVTVFQGPAASSTWVMPYPDPGEYYSDMVQQIFGSNASVLPSGVLPPMSGFAWNYASQPPSMSGAGWPSMTPVARDIMQYYSGAAMPVTSCLAQAYAVCDCWFAAAPVQTLSNRIFTHCGTPSKKPGTNESRINNDDYSTHWYDPKPTVTDTTIFELLDLRHPSGRAPECSVFDPGEHPPLNWKVYYHDAPASALCKYVYYHWCWYPYRYGGNVEEFVYDNDDAGENSFERDVRNGKLPKYSFIEPRYTNARGGTVNSNHPGGAGIDWEDPNRSSLPPPVNVMDGERLLWRVYDILLRYPKVFDKTLLIVTYDEHGGLFDHVPPPGAISPFTKPVDNFDYDRYGVRVPAIFINPGIAPKTIYPDRKPFAPIPRPPFDHTSLLSTLIAQFDLDPGLGPRVDSAPTLEGLVSSETYPTPACVAPPPAAAAEPRPVGGQPFTASASQANSLYAALEPLLQLADRKRHGPAA